MDKLLNSFKWATIFMKTPYCARPHSWQWGVYRYTKQPKHLVGERQRYQALSQVITGLCLCFSQLPSTCSGSGLAVPPHQPAGGHHPRAGPFSLQWRATWSIHPLTQSSSCTGHPVAPHPRKKLGTRDRVGACQAHTAGKQRGTGV